MITIIIIIIIIFISYSLFIKYFTHSAKFAAPCNRATIYFEVNVWRYQPVLFLSSRCFAAEKFMTVT